MIEIGSFIKMQRTKQKMTLGELAEGIVSVSYLSKIENLKTEASPHIIQLLCNRLGIELDRNMDDVIEEKCEKWFVMLLDKQDGNEIKELYNELQELLDSNLSDRVLLFEIHKIRYFLYLDEEKLALDQINKLNKMASSFDTRELYYWFKFRGNYNSQVGEDTTAIERYKKAEELSRNLDIPEDEIADLQYTMSIAYSQVRNTLEAIAYANYSLDIYMKKYNFLHCAKCHIVLGISYRRLKMYDKAIENYNLAKHLAGLNSNQELIQLTNQNLGYLYATLGKNKEAIKFYLEIVEDKNVNKQVKVGAITDLVKVYYVTEEFTKAKEMIDEALKLLDQIPQNNAYDFYYHVIHTYYYSITNQANKFVTLVKNKFIPLLIKRKDHANTVIFASMLAKHYEGIHKYKDATKYYKLANSSYRELSNL
ncbi:helix-turn-helix domain-containing protein [Oceanobacillus luteolus]|uniref:Helix-turn-helix domain-containing protein n=1 Tax=Oceanobacillus luteolus TaxID=1274358 RepID=A0ABW4HPL2_9BACI|nr:helix-turn-helix domain-containing protein [Oceanobacillus luteolus]MCM3739416.1 helix-turn-helix domain-containing protein [Oceanobacillus luteolus]